MRARLNGKRRYQRGLSKQMMKLNKYSASGATQRNGMTATSWHSLLVIANNRTDAQAGSSSQRRKVSVERRALSVGGTGGQISGLALTFSPTLKNFNAQNPQHRTYAAKPQPQISAWL